MRFPVYLHNVATLALDEDKCTGCGACLDVCPHAVLVRHNGRVRIDDRDACMECGACATNCPVQAVTVQSGVGCAMAVINTALGRSSSSCCCVIETSEQKAANSSGSTATPR
ncbi:MAG: mercury methylation ferredoxin HgcB [Desulfomonilaceae bacterium]|nr:mercury methylation ferredoxin HgcB [Desulfomonilaceae bacterium]